VASADFPHVVAPGETLTSVAAADGLSVAQVAAANGLSPFAQLVAGTTLQIPPQGVSAAPAPSTSATATTASSSGTAGDGDTDGDEASASGSALPGGSYVVQPGDTLTAIAARAGTTVAAIAAANGLDPNGVLLSGTALRLAGGPTYVSESSPSQSSSSTGSYVVQPGDTLSAIAARAGTTVAQLAAANRLNPNGVLLYGTTISVPGAGGSSTAASAESQPVGAPAEGNPSAPPYPTAETVSASQVGSIASANGVPPALAEAIGWQESGFNNDLVSSSDARGVMQILPGTWDWIQRTLTPNAPLAPASASSNVLGGVLLLRSLLNSTGGNPTEAAAGYYQGLSSVQQNGMYSDTQQYVNNVSALEQQFGGG
jgi:LysM repeat protein